APRKSSSLHSTIPCAYLLSSDPSCTSPLVHRIVRIRHHQQPRALDACAGRVEPVRDRPKRSTQPQPKQSPLNGHRGRPVRVRRKALDLLSMLLEHDAADHVLMDHASILHSGPMTAPCPYPEA